MLKRRQGILYPRGTLSFNWRIIQPLIIVVDYLIVHELAHVLEHSHSQAFWNIVAVHAPSWAKAETGLRKMVRSWNGARLSEHSPYRLNPRPYLLAMVVLPQFYSIQTIIGWGQNSRVCESIFVATAKDFE
ncbi:MAG: M48 family metallopeptidase [Burkholderiales bacterium]|nr:M48 family metallopeptidase [Burkholderiales bacterium]